MNWTFPSVVACVCSRGWVRTRAVEVSGTWPLKCAVGWLASLCVAALVPLACGQGIPDGQIAPRRSELEYRTPLPTAPPRQSLQLPAPNTAIDPSARVSGSGGLQPRVVPPVSNLSDRSAAVQPGSAAVRLAALDPVPALPTDRGLVQSPGHLNDVAFVDPLHGVAIGNQGLIWRTTDGGRRWSTIRCDWPGDLHRIVFADTKRGWIVGGRFLPANGMHEGVVLRTEDGGITWRHLTSTLLPRMTDLGYDPRDKRLWAVGEPSGQFPSGLFESLDWGTNWSDVPLPLPRGLRETASEPVAAATRAHEPAIHRPTVAAAYRSGQWLVANQLGVWQLANERATRYETWIASQSASELATAARLSRPGMITAADIPATDTDPAQPLAPGSEPQQLPTLQLQAVRSSPQGWVGLGTDNALYLSAAHSSRWERHHWPRESDGAVIAATGLAVAGDHVWVAPRVGRHLWRFNTRSRQWSRQAWPTWLTCHALFFLDEQTGWAVGAHGQVLHTIDGGTTWHWLHRSQPGLGVLVLAADAADVPPELVAHLSVNHGVNVGVLCGGSRSPWSVATQAHWQNEVSLVVADPSLFAPLTNQLLDPPGDVGPLATATTDTRTIQFRKISAYLSAWQPRVILICPTSGGQPLDQGLWLEAIQQQRTSGDVGQVAVVAVVNDGTGDTSLSAQGLAANVGYLLEDVAWPSRQLLAAWESPPATNVSPPTSTTRGTAPLMAVSQRATVADRPRRPATWSVRTVMQWELDELSWFHAKNAARGTLGHSLAVRPVRGRHAATNLESVHQMTRKSGWLYQMQAAPTDSPAARSEWTQAVGIGLMTLPSSVQSQWLFDLAEACEARGDSRKATLARWEILQAGLERPEALAVLLPTLTWLVSDEAQWPNRLEAKMARQQKFAELQRQFAAETARGELTEAERRASALRRFGVEPEMESRVPPEIIERILLLDTVQREAVREGRMEPDPEVARRAAVPQSRVLTDAQTNQQQSRFGQVQRHTTTLTWDTPLTPEGSGTAAAATGLVNPAIGSVVDASSEQRLEWVANLIKRADSIWPGLNGLPEWWQLKARVKQRQRDVSQTEIAWKRLEAMAAEPLLQGSFYSGSRSVAQVQREQALALVLAETGPAAALTELDRRLAIQLASRGDAPTNAGPASDAGTHTALATWPVLPVTWTLERPLLDGRLQESFWEADRQSIVRLAQDEQYLYLALCLPLNLTGNPYTPYLDVASRHGLPATSVGTPTADAPSTYARDRVDWEQAWTLTLDTDGDELNSFDIHVDAKGGVAERQGTPWNWNPTLFVASQQETQQRVIEMAIELDDLSAERLGKPWRLRLLTPDRQVLVDAWLQLEDLFAQ